ncbi:hypothetical protein [Alicyclobacillus acidiphilus]|uniref:hypothetical protein n=1 Tax=Alicyclobacillus acidiphilus TaxID=182455 RepID=UPI00082EC4FA|nr:hypothetical protein [Alicyclobacillus acidiphilus]
MVQKVLVAACSEEDRQLVEQAMREGLYVKVLDCFEELHNKVKTWYPQSTIQVPAHKTSVRTAVEAEGFDVAIVRETAHDFIRSALLVQALRESGVGQVILFCRDAARTQLYRRCGAHRVLVISPGEDVWNRLTPFLSTHITA